MPDLLDVPWPPEAVRTGRLIIRSTRAADRPGYIDLFCTDEGRRYLGGALYRDEIEAAMPSIPGHRPGVFAVELAAEFIGVVTLVRRDPERPGHVTESADEVEISYMLLPGSATRLGFREVKRFVEFDAEQWFGVQDNGHRAKRSAP